MFIYNCPTWQWVLHGSTAQIMQQVPSNIISYIWTILNPSKIKFPQRQSSTWKTVSFVEINFPKKLNPKIIFSRIFNFSLSQLKEVSSRCLVGVWLPSAVTDLAPFHQDCNFSKTSAVGLIQLQVSSGSHFSQVSVPHSWNVWPNNDHPGQWQS